MLVRGVPLPCTLTSGIVANPLMSRAAVPIHRVIAYARQTPVVVAHVWHRAIVYGGWCPP